MTIALIAFDGSENAMRAIDERSNRPSVAMRLKETRWQSLLKKRITRLIMWLNCVS